MPAETSLRRRFASPSCLLLALLMFPLPWVEIQCAHGKPPAPPPPAPAHLGEIRHRVLPSSDATTLASQSGLQAAIGTCSVPGQGEDSVKAQKKMAAHMSASLLMAAWAALALGGWLAGFLLPLGRCRLVAVGVCAGAALLLLAAQVSIGFPVERLLESDAAEQPPAEPAAGNLQVKAAEDEITFSGRGPAISIYFESAYTLWFVLAVLGTGGALILNGVEWWRDRRSEVAPQSCEPESPVRSP